MINKIHKTLASLLRKNYTVVFWSENNYCLRLAFYHLNSVHNGLVYISKVDKNISIDFQYHHKNKTVQKQLEFLGANIQKLLYLKQKELLFSILENYHKQASDKYYKYFSRDVRGKK